MGKYPLSGTEQKMMNMIVLILANFICKMITHNIYKVLMYTMEIDRAIRCQLMADDSERY